MRLHDLRHAFTSLMLAATFKPYEVSRWMGHGSVTTRILCAATRATDCGAPA